MLYDRTCRQCNKNFKGGPRAWYCPTCREERKRESWQKFANKGRKADRPIGSIDKCKICNNDFTVNSARQVYCPICAPEQIKSVDRLQGLEYYTKHEDKINTRRTMIRYSEKECVICGRKFKTKSKKLTCSDKCDKIRINQNWMKRYYEKKNISK